MFISQPFKLLIPCVDFRALNINDNKLKDFQINEVFAAIQAIIEKFDISGRSNAAVSLKNFNK